MASLGTWGTNIGTGAATGAMAGGLPGAAVGAGIGALSTLWGDSNAQDAQDYIDKANAARAAAKQKQLELLGQEQAPAFSDAMSARLKALEGESQASPLVEDPYFQGVRATAVRGGAQNLAGVMNRQNANDVSGGFSNTGSIQDVYDRLGGQLATIGQQSIALKAQKADQVAQMRQSMAEAQATFQNKMIQARMAIEAGDSAAAQQAMAQAYAAKKQAEEASTQLMMGLGSSALGYAGAAAKGAADTTPKNPNLTGKILLTPDSIPTDYPMPVGNSSQPWSVLGRKNQ